MKNATHFIASNEQSGMTAARICRCFLAVLLLVVSLVAAGQNSQQRWVTIGPEGGDVRSLAHDPHDPSHIFLGTSAGEMYLSTDAGATWSHFAHFGGSDDYVLDHIVVDSANPNTVYVAAWSIENSGGDIFRSRDGGSTWQPLPGMHGKSVRSFAVFAGDSRTLIAGALDGVFRSNDAGNNWERISPANHPEIKNIESIAIDPRSPQVIYAGTWHLPWKTTDGGATWQSMKQGIVDDSDVFSIIVDPQNPATVYLSACSGIYKSDNAGDLFHKIQSIPFSARRTRVLRQDPTNSAIVYAGTTEGLWRTLDGGKTWRRTTAPNLIVNDVDVDPRQPSHVLLATDRSGVMASEDGTQSVRASNRGFSHRQVSAVLADRNNPATLYAGVINDKEFGGVFVSHDAGAHWQQMNAGLSGHDIFTLAQTSHGDLLAGTQRGIYIYERPAGRWRATNLIVNEKIISTPARGPKLKNAKYATHKEYVRAELKGRVARIVVAGERWYAATSEGVFASYDQGHSWHGGPVGELRNFFSVDVDGEKVVASTPNSLAVSHNHGVAWTPVNLPSFVGTVSSVAMSPSAMWVSAYAGVFFSKDDGANWEHVLVGTPPQNLTSVRYDAVSQRLLGVTHSGEVYSTVDNNHWNRIADAGIHMRSVNFAGGRLLGITPFRGIVAPPAGQEVRATGGGLQ
ncbi:MAG TPA: transcriptional regulator [Terriglobales bacterium]|nr:transcriptional regulator [Terriglobales bacterium]